MGFLLRKAGFEVHADAWRALLSMCKSAALPIGLVAVISIPFGGPDLLAVGGALVFVLAFAASLWLYAMLFDLICVTLKFAAKWLLALLWLPVRAVTLRGQIDSRDELRRHLGR